MRLYQFVIDPSGRKYVCARFVSYFVTSMIGVSLLISSSTPSPGLSLGYSFPFLKSKQTGTCGSSLPSNPYSISSGPENVPNEFTSAADPTSRAEIHRAVREFKRGRTTFIITHEMQSLEMADRILVNRIEQLRQNARAPVFLVGVLIGRSVLPGRVTLRCLF